MARKTLGVGRDIKAPSVWRSSWCWRGPGLRSTLQTSNKDVNSRGSLEEGSRTDKRFHKTCKELFLKLDLFSLERLRADVRGFICEDSS